MSAQDYGATESSGHDDATAPAESSETAPRFPELQELEEEIQRRIRSNQRFLQRFLDEDFQDDDEDEAGDADSTPDGQEEL